MTARLYVAASSGCAAGRLPGRGLDGITALMLAAVMHRMRPLDALARTVTCSCCSRKRVTFCRCSTGDSWPMPTVHLACGRQRHN